MGKIPIDGGKNDIKEGVIYGYKGSEAILEEDDDDNMDVTPLGAHASSRGKFTRLKLPYLAEMLVARKMSINAKAIL